MVFYLMFEKPRTVYMYCILQKPKLLFKFIGSINNFQAIKLSIHSYEYTWCLAKSLNLIKYLPSTASKKINKSKTVQAKNTPFKSFQGFSRKFPDFLATLFNVKVSKKGILGCLRLCMADNSLNSIFQKFIDSLQALNIKLVSALYVVKWKNTEIYLLFGCLGALHRSLSIFSQVLLTYSFHFFFVSWKHLRKNGIGFVLSFDFYKWNTANDFEISKFS